MREKGTAVCRAHRRTDRELSGFPLSTHHSSTGVLSHSTYAPNQHFNKDHSLSPYAFAATKRVNDDCTTVLLLLCNQTALVNRNNTLYYSHHTYTSSLLSYQLLSCHSLSRLFQFTIRSIYTPVRPLLFSLDLLPNLRCIIVFSSCLTPCSLCSTMRQEGSPLDLNNLPEEYGKQAVECSTTTATSSVDAVRIKKKSGGGKDDAAKVYECRFCSLKFCKSQALGGHMNRHRQERETETLNRARQLVFGNESLAAVGAQMSFRDANMAGAAPPTILGGGGFRAGSTATGGGTIGDPCGLPFRPVHPRLSPQPSYHYLYTAPSTLHPMSYPATYPGPSRQPAVGDYVIGHAVTAGDALMPQANHRGSFSCFGAPLTAPPAAAAAAGTNVQADKVNCNCSFGCGGHSRNNNVNAST